MKSPGHPRLLPFHNDATDCVTVHITVLIQVITQCDHKGVQRGSWTCFFCSDNCGNFYTQMCAVSSKFCSVRCIGHSWTPGKLPQNIQGKQVAPELCS